MQPPTPDPTTAPALEPNELSVGIDKLPPPSSVLVIFGATGDLARRKLLPALYNLAQDGQLPERFYLVGVAHTAETNDEYKQSIKDSIREFSRQAPNDVVLEAMVTDASFISGGFEEAETYKALAARLAELDESAGLPLNHGFYLSTAPRFFGEIVTQLGAAGLNDREEADTRVIIEKPFGTTKAEALALNQTISQVLREDQIFRIDHYLGKETVQNLLALRFANGIFEPIWNRNHIASVQITAAETVGVEGRAGYYESAGAMRDLVENHLLQLVCLVAMEPPTEFAADDLRSEKVKVLRAITPLDPARIEEFTVRAQYSQGAIGGEGVPGYRSEPDVAADSTTETYAALKLDIDNWRWAGVPFYIRTGKRLARKMTEIAVTLRPVPHLAFDGATVEPNVLVFTIQPEEKVSIKLAAKVPGTGMHLRPVTMDFSYGTSFLSTSPEAYERLITDALRGDAMLFTRADEVEAQWSVVDPILTAWEESAERPHEYPAGSNGPVEQERLLSPGDQWRAI